MFLLEGSWPLCSSIRTEASSSFLAALMRGV
jgi:hypothetical protein